MFNEILTNVNWLPIVIVLSTLLAYIGLRGLWIKHCKDIMLKKASILQYKAQKSYFKAHSSELITTQEANDGIDSVSYTTYYVLPYWTILLKFWLWNSDDLMYFEKHEGYDFTKKHRPILTVVEGCKKGAE